MAGAQEIAFVVLGASKWRDLLDDPACLPDPDAIAERFVDANDVWVVQTYLRCARAGLRCVLKDRVPGGSVAVVSYHSARTRAALRAATLVVCQHDRPRPFLGDWRVVQNLLSVRGANDVFIPHWPQPGLRPRDPARGARMETLAYKGLRRNLTEAFRSPGFTAELAAMGVALHTSDRIGDAQRVPDWGDYRENDAVLAVRDDPDARLRIKPASKLINAWHAGVPALLGPEPVYRELRRSDLDYMEVATPDEAIEAVRTLRASPDLYRAMVENGHARAREFTVERTTERWVRFLEDRVLAAPPKNRLVRAAKTVAVDLPRHRLSIMAHKRALRAGAR